VDWYELLNAGSALSTLLLPAISREPPIAFESINIKTRWLRDDGKMFEFTAFRM